MAVQKQWPQARKISVGIWAATSGIFVVKNGVPFDRATQFILIVTAAIAFSVGTPAGIKRIFLDWVPFFGLLYAYDYSRGAADTMGHKVRVVEILNIEMGWFSRFFDGQLPSLWLQHHLYNPNHVAWWEAIVALMYVSHFIVPWAIIGTLYIKNRNLWAKFARRVIVISMAALITYILVPAAPPWYAAKAGLVEPIARIATRGWSILGIPIAGQIISLGQGVVNQVAAIPSLHAGMTVTISLFFWPRVRGITKAFFIGYVSFMIFTLAYGGEHYLFDSLLGILYAVAVEIICRTWERFRS